MRYKSRPITPVDAVHWNGENFVEVQSLCPQVTYSGSSMNVLNIPTPQGIVETNVGETIMRYIGTGEFTKMESEVFYALYEAQTL